MLGSARNCKKDIIIRKNVGLAEYDGTRTWKCCILRMHRNWRDEGGCSTPTLPEGTEANRIF